MIEFNMPSLGADMEDGTLVEWRVKPGDKVQRGDIVADVDTQKGLIEIEVFDEGIIEELIIKEGEKVPVGTLMALIIPEGDSESSEEKTETAGKKKKLVEVEREAVITPPKEKVKQSSDRVKISPLARKMAEENGIDISTLKGTGPEGSITKKDVEEADALKKTPQAQKAIHENKKDTMLHGVRSAIASAMSKSNREIPHFYMETKIDMSKALAWLQETNRKREVKDRLLYVVLLIKAMAKALEKVPEVNAYWENGLHLKEAINIGFAVSLRKGGVVIPAIHGAKEKTLTELMTVLNDLIPRAKALKLRSSELSESTITLTNIGEGNVATVFGVIYPPQVAIVGCGSIIDEAWAENGSLSSRPVIHITLAADHRAIDGYLGRQFLTAMKDHLQNPEML
ncbi:dihydrolipoamide acetyltransferase family protein [Maribacter halichondriae]|uniref:dihydrolipoamide acetyltransferase family protein n=1 Tax=Maribacter halichondriae TaxID=2980554 RepID=UPI0023581770|nr:dihydrolipoamide acetyltransferase family protein [Maribacter sp. Hal144]